MSSELEQLPLNVIISMSKYLDIAGISQLSQVSRTLRNSITPFYAGRLEGARIGTSIKSQIAHIPSCQVSIPSIPTQGEASAESWALLTDASNVVVNLNTSDAYLLESILDNLSKLPDLAELTICTSHSVITILHLASRMIDLNRLQLKIVAQGAGIAHLTDPLIGNLYQQLVLTFTRFYSASGLIDSMRNYFYNIRPFCLVNYAIEGVSVQFCHKLVNYAPSQTGRGTLNHKRMGSNSIVYFRDDRKRLRAL
ncbi:hypothetical protein E3P92_02393 [Wallemia ichthyophaga]|uniref:F-box domain-containing protein n=1 Tax=Wallemia ichthyophaga TaxID=245174 RepID=A0A4T0HGG8_WALIC|nr:hypothetical protein E3P98_02210 [Wallemia ichthyophaga]TIA90879.1 hypothetical protein E3P97_02334 [Wallemia ichthyophaga]TIA99758.1 hypothetical protein E3P95_01958 [Wallemia ichthyophaga]TIB00822.1 hypothetical protein E3P94_02082 [Wallemia ichthyophaga]TIB06598.1 hypothetical protein E3P96_00304 [Wallemia ichthyophaga]